MNRFVREIVYISPFVVISTIFSFIILLSSYPIHELGHASFAILVGMASNQPSIVLNFTYQPAFHYFRVPQQTIALLPTSPIFTIPFGIAGVFATTVFYFLIFVFVLNLRKVKENKKLQNIICFALITLIIDSILENLFCGTDGFRLSCNSLILNGISLLAWFMFTFFIALFSIFYVKTKEKQNDT